jgi:hypothetical protein
MAWRSGNRYQDGGWILPTTRRLRLCSHSRFRRTGGMPVGSTTTRSVPGGPGMPTSLCPCWPGLARRQQDPGRKKGVGTSDPGMIGYTLAEIRRLLNSLGDSRAPDPDGTWSWSGWRRRRQYQARICHYQRRGYALTWCATAPATLPREARQVGEGLVDGLGHALTEQPPGRLVSRSSLAADTGGVGPHSRLNHIEELPGGS